MKRFLLFAAAASAVLALPATAAAFRGAVVAKDPARHALVIASRGGVVRIGRNGLTATSFKDLGHSNSLELEGIFLGLSGDQLRLAAEHPGEVFVTVPGGFQLPALEPGDEIELDVSVDATTGAFTLVSIRTDDENDGEHGRVEARGTITQLTATSITVSGGREEDGDDGDGYGTPVTCAVADKSLLSGFQINDKVEMRCAEVNGTLTLVRLKKEDDDG